MSNPKPKRRGRQRSQEVDRAILNATIDILVEGGYGDFAVSKVIARAGVSSATLYRRWATGDDLVLAALAAAAPEPVEIDTGDFYDDIDALVDYLRFTLSSIADLAAAEAAGPRLDKDFKQQIVDMFNEPRMAILRSIIERANARGEMMSLPPPEDCWSFLVSPLHHRLYSRGEPLTTEFAAITKKFLRAGFEKLGDG